MLFIYFTYHFITIFFSNRLHLTNINSTFTPVISFERLENPFPTLNPKPINPIHRNYQSFLLPLKESNPFKNED